nr:hypothetical protein [Paraburkholderia sp. UCT2]
MNPSLSSLSVGACTALRDSNAAIEHHCVVPTLAHMTSAGIAALTPAADLIEGAALRHCAAAERFFAFSQSVLQCWQGRAWPNLAFLIKHSFSISNDPCP